MLNYEDEVLREFGKTLFRRLYIFPADETGSGYLSGGDQIILRTEKEEIPVVRTGELKLLGTHNFENVMAAVPWLTTQVFCG